MTNNQHGQVPEALRLAEQYDHGDPAAHGNAWKAAVCTELRRLAELEAQIEALSEVQALSAAPEAFLKSVIALCSHRGYSPANIEAWDKDDKWIADLWRQAESMLAASPTPPAEQQAQSGTVYVELPLSVGEHKYGGGLFTEAQMRDFADRTYALRIQAAPKAAPGEGNSGFDHQTAADFLSGKTVSDEAVRKFVQASRWAHDERAALSATLLAMHGVLTSREAEIALLKKALLEAEAAPQQEAQEPVAWLNPWRADQVTTDYDAYGERGIPLYTAPQPAPAPLSEMPYEKRKAIQEGEQISASDAWFKARHEMLDTLDRRNVFRAGFDRGWNAALAAQGGKA